MNYNIRRLTTRSKNYTHSKLYKQIIYLDVSYEFQQHQFLKDNIDIENK